MEFKVSKWLQDAQVFIFKRINTTVSVLLKYSILYHLLFDKFHLRFSAPNVTI